MLYFVTKDVTLFTRMSWHMMLQSLVGIVGKKYID